MSEDRLKLSEFIAEVKKEVIEASENGNSDPIFGLTELELEASFSVDFSGEAGGKFFISASAKAAKGLTQKVKLKLAVLPDSARKEKSSIDSYREENSHALTRTLITPPVNTSGINVMPLEKKPDDNFGIRLSGLNLLAQKLNTDITGISQKFDADLVLTSNEKLTDTGIIKFDSEQNYQNALDVLNNLDIEV